MGIVRTLEDLIKEKDENVEFKYLYLINKQLKWCRGCLNCLKKGGNFCPLKDDSAAIKEEIDSADGLIFASPCYAHQVSAIFKISWTASCTWTTCRNILIFRPL